MNNEDPYDELISLEDTDEIESIEIELLLNGIYKRYGYDFRNYAPASIRRRIWKFANNEGLNTISAVQERILHDPRCMDRFVLSLTVNVTSMFRDPAFFAAHPQSGGADSENLSHGAGLGRRLRNR